MFYNQLLTFPFLFCIFGETKKDKSNMNHTKIHT